MMVRFNRSLNLVEKTILNSLEIETLNCLWMGKYSKEIDDLLVDLDISVTSITRDEIRYTIFEHIDLGDEDYLFTSHYFTVNLSKFDVQSYSQFNSKGESFEVDEETASGLARNTLDKEALYLSLWEDEVSGQEALEHARYQFDVSQGRI